jgi:hypothetical protein
MKYLEARKLIKNGDVLMFPGKSLWPSIPIRWFTNGYKWYEPKCWCSLAPFSHGEIANWDFTVQDDPVLVGWGSVKGGARKTPLSRLLANYGSFGWCPLKNDYDNDDFRRSIMLRCNTGWRNDELIGSGRYPTFSQWWRTAFRNWYTDDTIDSDNIGYSCSEWCAYALGLKCPARWFPSELEHCGLVDPLVIITE